MQMMKLCVFVLIAVLLNSCNANINGTIGILPYDPFEICDPNDQWNQNKFDGLNRPFILSVLNKSSWNVSEIDFQCIGDWSGWFSDHYYNHFIQYDKFLYVVDGGLAYLSTTLFDMVQPFGIYYYAVITYYEQPGWLMFRFMNLTSLILFVLTPLILGTVFAFVTSKHSIQYLTSDYYGLMFFQPDIIQKRNVSHKIISWFFKAFSLVMITIILYSSQKSFRDMITTGNKSMDYGLRNVRLVIEDQNYGTVMPTMAIPEYSGIFFMAYDNWKEFLPKQPPGKAYLISASAALMLASEFCDYVLLGNYIEAYQAFLPGFYSREERTMLNIAILDTVAYNTHTPNYNFSYYEDFDINELVSPDRIKCKARKQNLNPRFTIENFKELWYIYCAGVIVAFLYSGIKRVKEFWRKKTENYIELKGVRKKRVEFIIRKVQSSMELSLLFLKNYQVITFYSRFAKKFKKVREKIKTKKPELLKDLKTARRKVVLWNLKKKKKKINFIRRALIYSLKRVKVDSLGKTSFEKQSSKKIRSLFGLTGSTKLKKQSSPRKIVYINSLIQSTLISILLLSLQRQDIYISELGLQNLISVPHIYIEAKKFHAYRKVKFPHETKSPFKVVATMYEKMTELFSKKMNQKISKMLVDPRKYNKVKKNRVIIAHGIEKAILENTLNNKSSYLTVLKAVHTGLNQPEIQSRIDQSMRRVQHERQRQIPVMNIQEMDVKKR